MQKNITSKISRIRQTKISLSLGSIPRPGGLRGIAFTQEVAGLLRRYGFVVFVAEAQTRVKQITFHGVKEML
jgi:hypothetical protein